MDRNPDDFAEPWLSSRTVMGLTCDFWVKCHGSCCTYLPNENRMQTTKCVALLKVTESIVIVFLLDYMLYQWWCIYSHSFMVSTKAVESFAMKLLDLNSSSSLKVQQLTLMLCVHCCLTVCSHINMSNMCLCINVISLAHITVLYILRISYLLYYTIVPNAIKKWWG